MLLEMCYCVEYEYVIWFGIQEIYVENLTNND